MTRRPYDGWGQVPGVVWSAARPTRHALNVRPELAIADVRARPGFRRNLADQTRPALPLPKTTNVIGELPH
jgi:hypothetical protein